MPIERLSGIELDYSVRDLCQRPYPNHPKGCPNYGKKLGCPPRQKYFLEVFDGINSPFYVIYTTFDLKLHVNKMKEKHPNWSERQLYCCLYWQGTARKNLRKEIARFKQQHPQYFVTTCPEAMGVNITGTMLGQLGIRLEWPPRNITYQVAIAGIPRRKTK